jgi:AraC family transcriptional regulator of adaptative response/methylated-DNA-[protein]-cysteine methyltransferase
MAGRVLAGGLAALWEPALRRGFRAGLRRPLHVQGTPFQLKVWQALVRIPEGRLVSYQALARAVGSPGAARAVGGAVGANSIAVLIPCHRVIREAGDPGGYRWDLARKQALIAWEAARKKLEAEGSKPEGTREASSVPRQF